MPLYDYQCNTCQHRFDEIVKFDAPLPKCPKCGQGVRKLISAGDFILKGDNWYKDGYGLRKP